MKLSEELRLQGIAETLVRLFYGLMGGALFIALFGSAGFAFLLLLLGGCTHVARVGVEELLVGRPQRRPVRPTS